jgi:hypothetical protein
LEFDTHDIIDIMSEEKLLKCSVCKLEKPETEFHVCKKYVNRGRHYLCKQCTSEYRKKMYEKDIEKSRADVRKWQLANPEKLKKSYKNWAKRNPLKMLLKNIKNKCRWGNIPFNLTLEDIKVPDICPVFGIPLMHNSVGMKDNSPSVDRLIPEKGYIKENIRVISWRANRLKCDGTLQELEAIVKYMKENCN